MLDVILWLQEFSRVCYKAWSSIDQLDPALILDRCLLGKHWYREPVRSQYYDVKKRLIKVLSTKRSMSAIGYARSDAVTLAVENLENVTKAPMLHLGLPRSNKYPYMISLYDNYTKG